jgi:cytochrome c553
VAAAVAAVEPKTCAVRYLAPWIAILSLAAAAPAAVDDAFFEKNVRPVLAGVCVRCHGPQKASGGLRLDSRQALIKGGDSGPVVMPGRPEQSLLLDAVRRKKGVHPMPPGKEPLPAAAVADLQRWIAGGAPWPVDIAVTTERHWAFEPVRPVHPPAATGANPIDAFLAVKHNQKELTPTPPADRRTLMRRVTFDLIGLPPRPDDVQAFVDDPAPDAFRRVVDRLLASPQYGEKWGRHWLDVVRYADTAGETADFPVPDAWRYRNYVIASFNADKPYDQFLREQIAGDLLAARLPAGTPPERFNELVIATGYIAIARRFGFDISHDHFLTIEDTIDTLGKSVLGLTIGCARCHDHKYDPITTQDYYALYGVFESTRYPFSACEKDKRPRDLVPLAPAGKPGAGTAYAVAEGSPHNVRQHLRGDPESPGNEVPRRFLQMFGGQLVPAGAGSGRLQLAEWLRDPNNPLTARVMVNRIWQGHFGAGLVRTANDFGTRGTPPSHPELLDHLARRFIDSGWSVKPMHRLIVLSDAYQRSAAPSAARGNGADPGNTYLWQFPRRRLSAEEIRDAMLEVSGDLDLRPGQGHPFPPEKGWGFTQHNPFQAVYDHNRRSVYLMTQRIRRHPFLALFDGADTNSSTAGRFTTTVPTQALFFLNDPFVHARAESLVRRLAPLPEGERLNRACQLLFGRPAVSADQHRASRFLQGYRAELGNLSEAQRDQAAWAALLRVLLSSNEFIYVN